MYGLKSTDMFTQFSRSIRIRVCLHKQNTGLKLTALCVWHVNAQSLRAPVLALRETVCCAVMCSELSSVSVSVFRSATVQ